MNEITDAFIRSVKDRVETISTVGQIRECMKMYESVLYNSSVRKIFLKRILSLEDMHTDKVSQKMLADSLDQLEEASEIGSCNLSLKSGITFNLVFRCQEGSALESSITEVICTALRMAEGKKKEAARILGVSTPELTTLIDRNANRRTFLQELKKKLKSVEE